mmetsp:Transcript_38709/g.91706  ORF Transcript_38709/g.91706 Transcript_38709/m.91706 type:complete len:239 (+) Transcript_38709:172-888(+)
MVQQPALGPAGEAGGPRSVQAVGLAHRRLEVEALDVLPVLLQERHEEVDRHLRVDKDLLVAHGDVPNGHAHAQDLLQLELDGGLDLVNLVLQGLVVGDEGGELAGLVEAGTQETGDHLDDRLRRQESLVLFGELLHQLLVLVELLQLLNVHGVDANCLGLFAVLDITQDADLHLRPSHERKLDSAAETLVLLRVIVLQTNLELDSLREFPLLLLRPLENRSHGVLESFALQLAHAENL